MENKLKKISIVASCYNEQNNVAILFERIKNVFVNKNYIWELILLDNASTDNTVEEIKKICIKEKNVKLIVNARNFGCVKSPFHGLMQADGDAVILIASDLEDPPELINDFLIQWEKGFDVVAGVYKNTNVSFLLKICRKLYYWTLDKLADARPIPSFTGFALYSKRFIEIIKKINDPYPYLRGMVSEIGLPTAIVEFDKPKRVSGVSKSNFLALFDMAICGFVSMSKAPIRLATLIGGAFSIISFLIAIIFLMAKLFFWDHFSVGVAPLLIGMFFIASIQLLFLGLIGEYIASIHQKTQNRPLVIEKERVNFIDNNLNP